MICGRKATELGGSMRHLDVVGINYYWTNQWELGRTGVPLEADDPRLSSLADLVRMVWERYRAPMLLSETAHGGDARPGWIREVARAARELVLVDRVPLLGACIYPILGMPEWHEPDRWARLGLWDVDERGERHLHLPSMTALREAQRGVEAEILAVRRSA
jgi:hypothetical protein